MAVPALCIVLGRSLDASQTGWAPGVSVAGTPMAPPVPTPSQQLSPSSSQSAPLGLTDRARKSCEQDEAEPCGTARDLEGFHRPPSSCAGRRSSPTSGSKIPGYGPVPTGLARCPTAIQTISFGSAQGSHQGARVESPQNSTVPRRVGEELSLHLLTSSLMHTPGGSASIGAVTWPMTAERAVPVRSTNIGAFGAPRHRLCPVP